MADPNRSQSALLGRVRQAARLLDLTDPGWASDVDTDTPDLARLRNRLTETVRVITDPAYRELELRWGLEVEHRRLDNGDPAYA